MDVFLYLIIFIIGSFLGSFCTLAVYRIPLKKDITHERSFCPNCNHELGFFDLIPVFSYIFLGGRCRYCRKKIRMRYIILEVFSGTVAIFFGMSFKFDFTKIELIKYVSLLLGLTYITALTIIAGIDKERKQIQKSVLVFECITTLIYILYLSIVEHANVERYAIYLFFMFILICIKIYDCKNKVNRKIPIGFYISIINIVILIVNNYIFY